MSNESANEKLPWDMANLQLLEKGNWYLVQVDSQKLFVKIPEEQCQKFFAGEMVEAYHPMTANTEKPAYLPALMGTVEPWYISGTRCGLIAPLHPVQAQAIDLSLADAVQKAKEDRAAIIKPGPKKLILT